MVKYNGRSLEVALPDAGFKAVCRGLTDGNVKVEVLQEMIPGGAWCFVSMETWDGHSLHWGSKSEDSTFLVGPKRVPMREVVFRLRESVKDVLSAVPNLGG
jgi:hypothetical protein